MLPVWIQYLNGDLQFFPHAEGYVKPNGTNSYLYVYQYKDHLGNVRLSYADCDGNGIINPATEILEENNYYPFGLKHQGYNDIANSCRSEEAEAYKLNGKEYEDSFGLNIYEMDLRQYDPAIGRWTVMDPVTHHDYSPYSAFDNNPVYWSDPSGADATTYTLNGNLVGASFTEQDAIDAFMQLVNGSANDYFEVAVQNTYELSTLPDDTGGGGGGNGNGNGKSNNESNNKLIDEKIQQYVKFLKATDLALNLNQYNSYYANKFVSNALYKRAIPIIEIGGNYYRLYYSQELNNNYSKGEFIYDTTGTLTGFTVGATIGGLPGAVIGVLVGASFEGAKEAYRVVKPGFLDGFNNFINSAVGNWMKYN